MIVRILGEGQFELDKEAVDQINTLDDDLMAAVDTGDEAKFREALQAIHAAVIERGTRTSDDSLVPSELILPDVDATIAEVAELLADDGLIPG